MRERSEQVVILGQAQQDAPGKVGPGQAEQRLVMQAEDAVGIIEQFLTLCGEQWHASAAVEQKTVKTDLKL